MKRLKIILFIFVLAIACFNFVNQGLTPDSMFLIGAIIFILGFEALQQGKRIRASLLMVVAVGSILVLFL